MRLTEERWREDYSYSERIDYWPTVLSQQIKLFPRWWSKNGRKYKERADFFHVYLGNQKDLFSVQLGTIYRVAATNEFRASLLPRVLPTYEELHHPKESNAYSERWETEIGTFPSRMAAARALKEASLDRGMLAPLRALVVHPLEMLAETA